MASDPPIADASGGVFAMLRRLLRPHVRLLVARRIPYPPLHDLRRARPDARRPPP